MDSILQIIRQIVRDEIRGLCIGELGTVTSVSPVADRAGQDNYACSVKLRDRDVELRKVPICTPHNGMVSCPQSGELVLVSFVGGNANNPIIIGRVHSERIRPPVHEDGELVIETNPGGDTRMSFRPDGTVEITSGDALWNIAPDGAISLSGSDLTVAMTGDVQLTGDGNMQLTVQGDANVSVDGSCTVETTDCMLHASGNIELGEGGGGVITDRSHKCYYTGAPLVGSATVTAKG